MADVIVKIDGVDVNLTTMIRPAGIATADWERIVYLKKKWELLRKSGGKIK